MSKVGIVFKFEAIRQLKKPTFWISLLLFPLGIFAAIGLHCFSHCVASVSGQNCP